MRTLRPRSPFVVGGIALLSVLAASAACGSSEDDRPAAEPVGDGGAEAGEDAARDDRAQVTVEAVTRLGELAPNTPVLVSRVDGSVASLTKTGVDGRVTVPVPEGGAVSVFSKVGRVSDDERLERSVRTFPAPRDGALLRAAPTIRFGTSPDGSPAANDPMSVEVKAISAANAPAGTAKLELELSCAARQTLSFGTPRTVAEFKGCAGRTTYDVFVLARDAEGLLLGYGAILDQAFKPGTTDSYTLNPTRTTFVETRSELTAIPTGFQARLVGYGHRAGAGSVDGLNLSPEPGASTYAGLFRAPVEFGERVVLRESAQGEVAGLYQLWRHEREFFAPATPPATSTVAVDRIASVREVSDVDRGDARRPAFRWALSPSGARDGCVRGELDWHPADREYTWWTIHQVAADVGGRVSFPELPPELAEFAPTADLPIGDPTVLHHDVAGKTGLAACTPERDDDVTTWSVNEAM